MLRKRFKSSILLLKQVFWGTGGDADAKGAVRLALMVHQLSWGGLNMLVGVAAGLFCIWVFDGSLDRWKTVCVVSFPHRRGGAVSLGPVVIARCRLSPDVLNHEWGHWRQSIVLGPLYFLVIGVPSVLHLLWFERACRGAHPYHYYRFYTEAWADAWGGSWEQHRHSVKHWWQYPLRPQAPDLPGGKIHMPD